MKEGRCEEERRPVERKKEEKMFVGGLLYWPRAVPYLIGATWNIVSMVIKGSSQA